MASKKAGPEEWAGYLTEYGVLEERLSNETWFREEWLIRKDYLGGREAPRGVWLQLIKPNWFDGNIHIETWVGNADLERKTVPVVLHVETSKEKHGLSRNVFAKLFLEKAGDLINAWEGYTMKPNYAMEPVATKVPFSRETLTAVLEVELTRIQQLGPIIDRCISDATA